MPTLSQTPSLPLSLPWAEKAQKQIQKAIDLLEASDKKDALLSDYQRGYSDNYLCEKYM